MRAKDHKATDITLGMLDAWCEEWGATEISGGRSGVPRSAPPSFKFGIWRRHSNIPHAAAAHPTFSGAIWHAMLIWEANVKLPWKGEP